MPLPPAFRLAAAVSLLTGLAAASQASDWGDVVAVSSTMGVHDGRVCVGEATRGDIGCPTYAPQVGTDGSISASAFVGDGSGLTGVVAGSSDRIVSGTTSLLAVSSTGFVSLTQAGTNTGWFDPTRGLVTLGVSSTGRISAVELTVRGTIDIVTGTDVVGVGQSAATGNTGSYVTAVGSFAGNANTGTNVAVLGSGSGQGNTGNYLAALGVSAAQHNRGNAVVALGHAAARLNSSSYVTTAGYAAGQYNTGANLAAVGNNAAEYNRGTDVVGIGNSAVQYNSSSQVTAVGSFAARLNNGSDVTAVGYNAAGTSTGAHVSAFGSGAGNGNTQPYLTAVGRSAGANNTGGNSVLIGALSGQGNSGNNATALGYSAGYYNTGNGGVFIGNNTALNNTGGSATIVGFRAGISNPYNNVTLLGAGAVGDKHNQIVLGDNQIVEVSTAGVILARGVSTTGTVTATRFVGDGSGLTNLQGASADRIVSGTTSMLAVSDTGFVSLTQAGTNTGWFDPTRGLVTLGVSSTGGISGTTGYFNGNATINGTLTVGNAGNGMVLITSPGKGAGSNNLRYGVIIGDSAGVGSAFGGDNIVFIGTEAGYQATGHEQVGVGRAAGYQNANGYGSVFLGNYAGYRNVGTYITAVGNYTGYQNNGARLTAVGAGAAFGNTGGSVTALGHSAGYGNGVSNTFNNVTLLGAGTFATKNNQVVLGDRQVVEVSTAGVILAAGLNTTGTVTATRFVGDGSGLTGVVASTADRIVSGTTSMVAVSSTGFVSLTQAGTNTGWFDPTRGLVTLGVSATGAVSATRGYFSGNTGFGVSNPLTAIDAAGALHVHDAGTAADNNYQGALRITRPSSAAQYINLVRAANAAWSIGTVYGTSNFAIGQGAFTDSSFTNPFFMISAIGQVGIGTTTPTAALDTAGAIHVHDTGTLADNSYQGALRITRPSSAAQYINLVRAGNAAWSIGTVYGTSNFAIGQGAFADSSFTNPFFVIGANGRVGIGIATPTVSLEVSGTISATDIKINGTSLAAPQNVTHVSQTGPIVFRDPSNSLRYLNNDTFYLRGFGWNASSYPMVNIGTNQSATAAYLSLGTLNDHHGLYIKDDSVSSLTRSLRIDSSTSGARAVSFFSNGYLHETRLYGNRLMLRGGENMANPYTLSLDTANNAIGVNTQSPTATLEVSGTVSATYVKLADNDDRPCAPEHNGTIRFFNGRISLCRSH